MVPAPHLLASGQAAVDLGEHALVEHLEEHHARAGIQDLAAQTIAWTVAQFHSKKKKRKGKESTLERALVEHREEHHACGHGTYSHI